MFETKISHKNKIILFILLLILNIVIRIPSIIHEKGNDSFFVHILANSITTFGEAKWMTNWLSIFGLYPASEASATPFILSGLNQLINFDLEKIILLFCVFMGILSVFTSFILGGFIYNNFIFKYVFALIFSLSQGTLIFTTWEISARGLFIVFFPLYIYLVLRFISNKKTVFFVMILINLLLLYSIHNFAYFALFLFVFGIIFSFFFLALRDKIKLNNKISITIYLILILLMALLPFFDRTLISDGSKYQWITDMGIIELRYIGPLAIFILGGVFQMIFRYPKTVNETFILLSSILFLPIIYSQIYGHYIYDIFFIFFVSFSFTKMISLKNKYTIKYIIIYVSFLIIIFLIFSTFYNHWRTGTTKEDWAMKEAVYVSGEWANNYISNTAVGIGNDQKTNRRFSAISNEHPMMYSEETLAYTYGLLNISEIPLIQNSPLSMDYYFNGPSVFKYGYAIDGKINWILQQNYIDYPSSKEILMGNNVSYFIVDTNTFNSVLSSLDNKKLLYSNGRIKIYKINIF